MANQALTGSSSQQSFEGEDPIAAAQKTTRAMIADDMVAAEVDKKKAEADKAKAEADEAKARARRAEEAPSSGQGVKIEGQFNIQDIFAEKEANLAKLTAQAQEAATTQFGISEALREQLHAAQLEALKTGFTAQMEIMTQMIQSNASKGSFLDQFEQAKAMANQLGYLEPGAGSSDLQTTLAIKKLEWDQASEARRAKREERAEDRRWQLELRRLDDDRDARQVEAKAREKRDTMIAGAPAAIGSAIAQGMMDRGGSGAPVEGDPGARSRGVVEAGVGESGTFPCAKCQQPVAIGPTARTAACASPGCGAKYSIKRVQAQEPSEDED